MLAFTLVVNFVDGLNVFDATADAGVQDINEENVLSKITGLSDENADMNYIWAACTSLSAIGAIALAYLFKQMIPVGIWLFGTVFWTSYLRLIGIVNVGGFLDNIAGLVVISTVLMMFLFIAATIGLITGNG